jgi:carbonic anhydrase
VFLDGAHGVILSDRPGGHPGSAVRVAEDLTNKEVPVAEIDRMLEANQEWAQRFPGSKPVRPARAVAVVACMDSRMPLFGLLGLDVGDAHVIRNAGGVITEDTIRSLTISQHVLGTREIVLVHHTECGLQATDDVSFADLVEQATGRRPPWAARTFTDVDDDVRESIRLIQESPYLLSREVRGTVYDVETGHLREVVSG